MIINPCFVTYATTNIAEHFTQPVDYFKFSGDVKKVPLSRPASDYLDPSVTMIIVGGGGIVRDEKTNAWLWLKAIADQAPTLPIVIWGMGINDHGRFDRNYDETLSDLESRPNVLIGLRDAFYRCHVPCASCMRPEFDTAFPVQHEIGLYVHHAFDLQLACPRMSNQVSGNPISYFWRVLQFLGSCDVVVTNTYHGAYWATLLKRKVIVVAPFSNKFLGFKHEPIIIHDISWLTTAVKIARSYPHALSESRQANIAFYQRALSLQQALVV
jgi:polysaccharide pyruvyl transferase WcaK-like protein